MSYRRGAFACPPAARVAISPEIRKAVARLDVELGRAKALRVLGLSDMTLADVALPGGVVTQSVLTKLQERLALIHTTEGDDHGQETG